MVGWSDLFVPGSSYLIGAGQKAAKGGVPDEMPFNLTAKYAIRQAMQSSLALANRINDRVGLQDITGSNAGSQPIFSAADVAKRVQKQNIKMGMGNPGVMNGQ